jgi:hypothetical protein
MCGRTMIALYEVGIFSGIFSLLLGKIMSVVRITDN